MRMGLRQTAADKQILLVAIMNLELKKKKKRGEGADNVGNSSLCIFAPSGKDEVTRKTLTLSLNN